jgi:trk system potassium uptake protein TrkH
VKRPEPPGASRRTGIVFALGLLVVVFGLLAFVPLLWIPAFRTEGRLAHAFWVPAAASILLGVVLAVGFRRGRRQTLTLTDGAAIVLLAWLYACLVGAVPFMLAQGLGFLRALFESVSGLTTTGLSVVDVRTCPHLIVFWRSWLQLIGGAGFAIVMMSAIIGPFAAALVRAEGHTQPLMPHVRSSAGTFLAIYLGYAVAGLLAYALAGMPWFDAVVHSCSALSTGGFSSQAGSIGAYHSLAIELITIVLMLLGATSFVLHHEFCRGHFRAPLRLPEPMVALGMLVLAIPLLAVAAARALPVGSWAAIRVGVFEAVSALTTTGYTTTSYAQWSGLGVFALIVLMTVGGATASTAGGVKQLRVFLLLKSVVWDIKRRFLPRNAVVLHTMPTSGGRAAVTSDDLVQVANFTFLYFGTYVMGVALLLAAGCSLRDSAFEFASALATTGLSVGVTSPTSSPLVLWTEIGGMFLGRLEFLVVVIGAVRILARRGR